MRLIQSKDLLQLFEQRVMSSKKIDIASAWATSSKSLGTLARAAKGRDIRSIIGTSGRATDPDALDELERIGELRLAEQYPMFHPKIYIFRGSEKSFAWIGSANFTAAGGFGRKDEQDAPGNTEALFETQDCEAAAQWFEKKWGEFQELRPGKLEEYRQEWSKRPPSPSLRKIVAGPRIGTEDRHRFLDEVDDWRGYIRALKECDAWWRHKLRDSRVKFSVLGKRDSWFHTISMLRPMAKEEDWSRLEHEDSKKLLGLLGGEGGWALLGNMRGAAKACSSFVKEADVRRKIGEIVGRVITAEENEFPECAVEAINEIKGPQFDRYGMGVATRLLALARPDKCVSLNGQSRVLLVAKFRNVGQLTTPNGYGKMLQELYRQPWYCEPEPRDQNERELWSMRAALIDCFVYERPKSKR